MLRSWNSETPEHWTEQFWENKGGGGGILKWYKAKLLELLANTQ